MGRLKRKKPSGQKKSSTTTVDKNLTSDSSATGKAVSGPGKKSSAPAAKAKKVAPVKKSSKPVKASGGKKTPNIIDKSLQFLREVKVELKKVTWPSRKQALGSTVVVLILAMIISLFLGIVDMGLSGIIRVILN